MSSKGNSYDNAYAESFIKTRKSEEVHLCEYRITEDVQETISCFIEDVYDQKRLHSSLGCRPPCEFEAMVVVTKNPRQRAHITSPYCEQFVGASLKQAGVGGLKDGGITITHSKIPELRAESRE